MLEARALTKRYATAPARTRDAAAAPLALDAFSIVVPDGHLVALLGANGAGKSTTMRCFLDFTRPTEGQALVDGIDVAREPLRAKARLAFVPEMVAVHESLSGRQNLAFFAGLDGRTPPRRDEAVARLVAAGLAPDAAERPVREYSKGMRQKLGLAIAAARGAHNLLLDEPTSGLDPDAAADLMTSLLALRGAGAAILMATHDVFRARDAADHIVILRRGRTIASLARAEFVGRDPERLYRDALADDAARDRTRSGSPNDSPFGDAPGVVAPAIGERDAHDRLARAQDALSVWWPTGSLP
jgi:ABC-2 type transport system ATP-binding protein